MAIYGQPEHEIVIDINPYLIDAYPFLTWHQRNSIGHLVTTDPEFDLDPIFEQIDAWVYQYCEDKGIDIPEDEESDEE